MRRLLFSVPVLTAVFWLTLGVWVYALEQEPGSKLYDVRWLPAPKHSSYGACQ